MPFTSRKKKSEYDARYRASHREYILKCKIEWYAAHRKENAEKCWSNMHRRCNNPVGRSAAYVGVRVCRRWSGPKGKVTVHGIPAHSKQQNI